jgi:rubrerythrin
MYEVSREKHMSTDKKDSAVPSSQGDGSLNESTRRELITALQQNWQREMEGVRTYSDLAQGERDPTRRKVLEKLAEAEHGT